MTNHHKKDNILSMDKLLLFQTPEELNKDLALRIKHIRRRRKISQEELSSRSGVSLGSIKRFETSGQISLISLTKIAVSLGLEGELARLFSDPPFLNIEEVIRGQGK